jgi:hypothetical protein
MSLSSRTTDACRKTDAFINNYYRARDKSRLSQYYNQNSKIVWNGNPMNGLQFLDLSMPSMFFSLNLDFRISSYDVQDCGSNLLISVSGSVSSDEKHLFSQVFLAAVDRSGQLTIMAEIFRYV